MEKCYLYLRNGSDDRGEKVGIPMQRIDCAAFTARVGLEVSREFLDDGITGTILMDLRPAGSELVKAVAESGVKAVVAWNGEVGSRATHEGLWQVRKRLSLARRRSHAKIKTNHVKSPTR